VKKRNWLIVDVSKQYHMRSHDFGIQVPKICKEAAKLDKESYNNSWWGAIKQEMDNVQVSLKILNDDELISTAYQEIMCHVLFDMKMEGFWRKACFVTRGHTTETHHMMTYASVVLLYSVRFALTLEAMIGLDVNMADIEKAYLMALNVEKL
jgi:hypothetical protein